MKLRLLMLSLLFSVLALPALAVVKVYNSTPPAGIPGDTFQYTTTLCPPISATLGHVFGHQTLSDTGGGSVTMVEYLTNAVTKADLDTTDLSSVFGPGAFVFVDAITATDNFLLPHVGTGSTAPGGTVSWGVLAGFRTTGFIFCASSPQTICTGSTMVPHGLTAPIGPPASPTYDLLTWTFDAEGDLTADSYITQTSMGGLSNRQTLVRGAYVGAGVPALPLVGAGALALGLAIAGTRSLLRKQ